LKILTKVNVGEEIKMTGKYEVPFERSYWVIPGKLLAGCYPGDRYPEEAYRKLNDLVGAGIRCVVNLMEEDEVNHIGQSFKPYESVLADIAAGMGIRIATRRIPIRDGHVPAKDIMVSTLDLIDQKKREGSPVYIHCWGGRGRTGIVVGCYLARHGDKDPLATIKKLRKNDPGAIYPSPETMQQCELVRLWHPGE
jgi:hypothetical protein